MHRQHAAPAGGVAEPGASRDRTGTYDRLVAEPLGRLAIAEVAGKRGASYQVEVEGFWDSGHAAGGGFRAFRPLAFGSIVRPDGTFVDR